MEITNEIITKLDEFVEVVAEDQHKPQQKFVWEMLFGMVAAGSVVLADIGRQLDPEKRLIHVEKRLSSNLASERLDEEDLQQSYLDWVSEDIKEDTVISFDIGDIRKPYAEKMENLAEVWDGSQKEKAPGYWLMEVEGHQSHGERFGIWLEGWSQEAEDFVSRNRIIGTVVEKVAVAADGRGLGVFDRGFDGQEPMKDIEAWLPRYIIRQTGERHVQPIVDKKRRAAKAVRAIADDVKLRYEMKIWHRDKVSGRWQKKRVRYGFCQIYWPVTDKVYTLVVAVGLGKDPLMLWTNLKVRGQATAQFVVQAFLRRWAVEDCGRVIKQEFQLEKVRVEGWVSIRRSIILAGLAYGFLCYIGRLAKTIVVFITSQVRAFRAVKKVIAYRIRQGLARLWRDGLLFRPSNFG